MNKPSLPNLQSRYAKANPGKLNYASSGNGSMHLGTELLNQRAGIELEHVPYKGTGPVMRDLLSGRGTCS
jgi:tripartite-type tricarboxylate transporter receptor subunit TctC